MNYPIKNHQNFDETVFVLLMMVNIASIRDIPMILNILVHFSQQIFMNNSVSALCSSTGIVQKFSNVHVFEFHLVLKKSHCIVEFVRLLER